MLTPLQRCVLSTRPSDDRTGAHVAQAKLQDTLVGILARVFAAKKRQHAAYSRRPAVKIPLGFPTSARTSLQ
jgi:hypothetical protein